MNASFSNSSSDKPLSARFSLTVFRTISPYNSVAIRSSIEYGNGSPYQSLAFVYTKSVTTLGQSR